MPKRPREDSPASTTASPSPETEYPSPISVNGPPHSSKYFQTSAQTATARAIMKCSLPPHSETIAFSTFKEFEIHYAKVHAYRCSECYRNLPTEHFLGLHISENHDPLRDAKRAKGVKTYRCFVEDCDKVCSAPHKRRMHLIDKHMFPKNYDFLIVNSGIDKRSSMLRSRHRRQSSAVSRALQREQQATSTEKLQSQSESISNPPNTSSSASKAGESAALKNSKPSDKDMDSLTSTMSALQFVPPSVRFGRGGRRGVLSRS